MRCIAATVHNGHFHHCKIEDAPHPTDVDHMDPCDADGFKRLHRWKDESNVTTTTAPPEGARVVCADAPESVPAAVRAANVAQDNGWTTQLVSENGGTVVTLKIERGDERGHASWKINGDGDWRFDTCLIGGQRFGARQIAERLGRPRVHVAGCICVECRPEPPADEGSLSAALVTGVPGMFPPIMPADVTATRIDSLLNSGATMPPGTAGALTPLQAAALAPPPPSAPGGQAMPTMTVAQFMAQPVKVPPDNGNSVWANMYAHELREIINHAGRNSRRNLQRHLGPSELGVLCDRQVVGKLLGLPPVNMVADPWPSIVGTAIHGWLDDTFQAANDRLGPRWITEYRVTPHPDHAGTMDLYDAAHRAVVDWKNLNADKIDGIRRKGPSVQYRAQLILYGWGARFAGLPVDRVALVALPRTEGSLNKMYVWEHVWTPETDLLVQEVFKLTDHRKGIARDVYNGQTAWANVPATPESETCYFCPFYRPASATDGGLGCPGTVH